MRSLFLRPEVPQDRQTAQAVALADVVPGTNPTPTRDRIRERTHRRRQIGPTRIPDGVAFGIASADLNRHRSVSK